MKSPRFLAQRRSLHELIKGAAKEAAEVLEDDSAPTKPAPASKAAGGKEKASASAGGKA